MKSTLAAAEAAETAGVYAAFLLVGTSCGWLLNNAVINLMNNEKLNFPNEGSELQGENTNVASWVGISSGLLYFFYLSWHPKGLPFRAEQAGVVVLLVLTICGLVMLAFAWNFGAPAYPVIVSASALANLIGNATYYLLFPCVATYYGGWLVAAVRAGSDFSSMIISLIGQVQYVDGKAVRFSNAYLFNGIAGVSMAGLLSWLAIMRTGFGLRKKEDKTDAEACECDIEKTGDTVNTCEAQGFFVPRSLLGVVAVGTIAQVCQWSCAASLGYIASGMTDPTSCDGTQGADANRLAQTLSSILLPVASVASSIAPCPRSVFYILAFVQVVATGVLLLTTFGAFREFWTTDLGRDVFIGSFSVIACLEGYLLTMAYRYVGDAHDVGIKARQSSSRTLSLLGVLVVNPISMIVSSLEIRGVIACTGL